MCTLCTSVQKIKSQELQRCFCGFWSKSFPYAASNESFWWGEKTLQFELCRRSVNTTASLGNKIQSRTSFSTALLISLWGLMIAAHCSVSITVWNIKICIANKFLQLHKQKFSLLLKKFYCMLLTWICVYGEWSHDSHSLHMLYSLSHHDWWTFVPKGTP